MICLLGIFLSLAHAKTNLTKVGACNNPDAPKKVSIIKQWHLAPKTITKGMREKYPHEKNQSAIYLFLVEQVKNKKIQLLVSEGCEGEINRDFKPSFNGWDYTTLKEQSQRKGFDRILTLVPLKIEARFDDKIRTRCGDSEELIQEGNLRVSNLRGWLGFWSRLQESKGNPEKLKLYSDSAAELLRVSKDTSADKLLAKIKERIKEELDLFNKSLTDRNTVFTKVLKDEDFKSAAVVIGGLHVEDLKNQIQKSGMDCEVLEPAGYAREDEKLIQEFQETLKN